MVIPNLNFGHRQKCVEVGFCFRTVEIWSILWQIRCDRSVTAVAALVRPPWKLIIGEGPGDIIDMVSPLRNLPLIVIHNHIDQTPVYINKQRYACFEHINMLTDIFWPIPCVYMFATGAHNGLMRQASTLKNLTAVCGHTTDTGCLYNVFSDPNEHLPWSHACAARTHHTIRDPHLTLCI